MSNGLKIDTELVNTSGVAINGSGTNFQTAVNEFKNHSESITDPTVWKGDDATAFRGVAHELGTLLDKASVVVQDVGTHLEDTAMAIDETVSENKSNIDKLNSI